MALVLPGNCCRRRPRQRFYCCRGRSRSIAEIMGAPVPPFRILFPSVQTKLRLAFTRNLWLEGGLPAELKEAWGKSGVPRRLKADAQEAARSKGAVDRRGSASIPLHRAKMEVARNSARPLESMWRRGNGCRVLVFPEALTAGILPLTGKKGQRRSCDCCTLAS